ncbi:uncharacterized protein A4U43_C03F12850 [Asparagus officinalis]|uniref:DYW domain-containing protein n=1 Tax=Asparagus officinalis TaxID=4686 RepID=A0A5P1F9M5_ASPOF|nr:uncharacterized protein A4U43_C03F12850 [Asparagus officinalis]
MEHFKSMREEYGINPKMEHCACLLDLLGKAGKKAYEFAKGKPDIQVWGALLGACRIHGDIVMAELVFAEVILKVEMHNVTICVLMANIYVFVGRWEGMQACSVM